MKSIGALFYANMSVLTQTNAVEIMMLNFVLFSDIMK